MAVPIRWCLGTLHIPQNLSLDALQSGGGCSELPGRTRRADAPPCVWFTGGIPMAARDSFKMIAVLISAQGTAEGRMQSYCCFPVSSTSSGWNVPVGAFVCWSGQFATAVVEGCWDPARSQYLTALCWFAGLLGDAESPGGAQGAAHATDLSKPQHCGSAALSPLMVCGLELGEISLCWIRIIGWLMGGRVLGSVQCPWSGIPRAKTCRGHL